jgi:RNA polymerase sigma-70 factor (ECF subfamily)
VERGHDPRSLSPPAAFDHAIAVYTARMSDARDSALTAHRGYVFRLCYRMTGSAADAEDLAQETFLRALERPPADMARDPKPWLAQVAVNLSRDHLRARKRRGYTGPYLAAPVDTSALPADDAQRPDARYGELESLSFAFLAALEHLSATQRAVVILCDVMGYAVKEAAAALALSESNVKTTHHRARAALANYDAVRRPITRALQAETLRRLRAFLLLMMSGDVLELQKLLAADVIAWNDGDGEFYAARRPIVGAAQVILFHLKTRRRGLPRASIRMLNGLPALVLELPAGAPLWVPSASGQARGADPRLPRRMVIGLDVARDGNIAQLYAVVATRKLSHVTFHDLDHGARLLAACARAALRDRELRRSFGRALRRKLGPLLRRFTAA